MVKTPEKDSNIVLLKMERPVDTSDFARPLCLDDLDDWSEVSQCATLGWDLSSKELVQVQIRPTYESNVCQGLGPLSICTVENTAPGIPCSGHQMAGAPFMCQKSESSPWVLVGVLPWSKGCSSVGKRPRLYDKVAAINSSWAAKVMLKLSKL